MTPSDEAPAPLTPPPDLPAPAPDVRRLHPLSPFFQLLVLGRQFLVPLVVLVIAGRGDRGQFLPAVPIALGVLFGFLQWLRFTYTLDGRRLVIDEGVFTRKQRIVPLDRIQQVEMITRFRHRLLGVTVLRVDTAGGGGSAEVDLSVVSRREAARLREVLHPVEGGRAPGAQETPVGIPAPAPAERPTRPPLVEVGIGRLAVAGMTGAEMAVIVTILFWVFQLVDDLPDSFVQDLVGEVAAPSSLRGFVSAAGALTVLWFGLAATASILKNFGFTMRQAGDDLRVSRGLLDRREASMPVDRLQVVRVQATFVRRALGLVEVVLQSAALAGGGVGRLSVPILPVQQLPALLGELLPAPPPTTLRAAPPAARRRSIVRRVVPVTAVAIGAVVFARSGWAVVGALVAVVVAWLAGELAYRGLGHAWDREVLVARSGGLSRETVIVPGAKSQSTRLRSTPFQRRAGVATLFVDVAGKGRTPQVRDGDVTRLRELRRAVLLTPAARADEHEVRERPADARAADRVP